MMPLFSTKGRAALAGFLRQGSLLAFDYDGTLAPIGADRHAAYMRPATRRLLAALIDRHPTVVLSGRSREDVSRLLQGLRPLEIIGNHGAEDGAAEDARLSEQVQDWRRELDERLETVPGVTIEDKRWSLSVHYRQSPQPEQALAAVLRSADDLEGVRILGGQAVVNLLPADSRHKGEALLAACERHGYDRAIYLGDDETDEDVFRHCPPEQVLGIRVGKSATSAARFFLTDQDEVDRLLARLLPASSEQRVGVAASP